MKSIDNHTIVYEENKISENGILLVHGITSSKDEGGLYIELAELLNSEGYSTFRFDFRGHGESNINSNQITISGMIADLFETIRYMEMSYNKYSIIAASFGASILLLLLKNVKHFNNLESVVFLNPVTNYIKTFTPEHSKWASTFFPKGGVSGLLTHNANIKIGANFILNPIMGLEFFQYEPNKVKWSEKIPLMILHGRKDEIVSIAESVYYKNDQLPNVKLIEFEFASHGLEENKSDVFSKILGFLKNLWNE